MPHITLDLLLLRDGALTLLVALVGGFAIPRLKNPRMGVGAHVTGVVNGVLLLVLGVLWPYLDGLGLWSGVGRWTFAISLPALWFGLKLAAAVGATRTAPIAGAGAPNLAGQAAERIAIFFIAVPSLMLVAANVILIVGLFGLNFNLESTAMPSRDAVDALAAEIEAGRYVDAIEQFYAPNASMQENGAGARVGRELLMEGERAVMSRFKSIVAERIGPALIEGDIVAARWLFTFTSEDGSARTLEEIAWQRWEGEQVAEERFFYDPAQMR